MAFLSQRNLLRDNKWKTLEEDKRRKLSFQFGYELLGTTERRKEAKVDPIKFIEAVNITSSLK
jgi:hypothetical protein